MGIVVVVIIGSLVYRYFRRSGGEIANPPASTEQGQEERETGQEKKLPTTYQVQRGDSLWKIAENFYLSGYNWVDIAQANNLTNPNVLYVGQKLTIPDVTPKKPTVTAQKLEKSIAPGKYVVQKGDWLSKIALRAYGDMFAWEKIYEANKETIGPNPNLIKPGQELIIPKLEE